MRQNDAIYVFTVAAGDQSLDYLMAHLSPSERDQAHSLSTERRRRQYLLGRLAARAAVRSALGSRMTPALIEISNANDGAPRVLLDGSPGHVSVSLSHSGSRALACAWMTDSGCPISAGVDMELVRTNQVAESEYAFSRRERTILARAPEGPEIAGLAAWTVKESVWKALRASQKVGPASIEIEQISLGQGYAVVKVEGELLDRLGNSELSVMVRKLEAPDGAYVVGIVKVQLSAVQPTLTPLRIYHLDVEQATALLPTLEPEV